VQLYQKYWTSHAQTGDPNACVVDKSALEWPQAKPVPVGGDLLIANTLQPFGRLSIHLFHEMGYRIVNDPQNGNISCSFWRDLAFEVEKKQNIGGEFERLIVQGGEDGEFPQVDGRLEL